VVYGWLDDGSQSIDDGSVRERQRAREREREREKGGREKRERERERDAELFQHVLPAQMSFGPAKGPP
jgi:hypothetical protein